MLEGLLPNGQRVRWALGFELPDRGDHLDVQRLWARAAADDLEAALAAPA